MVVAGSSGAHGCSLGSVPRRGNRVFEALSVGVARVGNVVLDQFSLPVREWFRTTFAEPTPAQAEGWPAIAAGEHALILAPTGSGKTLAAFLWSIDRLMSGPAPTQPGTRVLYISPLRALAVDVDKNLRAPLAGIALAAE